MSNNDIPMMENRTGEERRPIPAPTGEAIPRPLKVEGTLYAHFYPTGGEVSHFEFVPFAIGEPSPDLPPSPRWAAIDLYLEQTLGNMQVQWNEDDSPAGD